MPFNQERWQQLLDESFPDGALVEVQLPSVSEDSFDEAPLFRVPYIHVVAMRGLNPVLLMQVFDVDKLIELELEAYAVVSEKDPVVWRVTPRNRLDRYVFSSQVPPALVKLMAPMRKVHRAGFAASGR